MHKPNSDQVLAAMAILRQFTRTEGASASETRQASCVYSIAAALGMGGQPSQDYAEVIAAATANGILPVPMIIPTETGFIVNADNPLGLTVGKEYVLRVENEEPEEPEEPAKPDDKEPGQAASEVPELRSMKKDELVAHAKSIGVEVSAAMTKDEIIAALETRSD
jgi:uncharacterized oligopeptide transporter (OPT) family protein